MYERRYDDAIAQFKRALEVEPGYRLSHYWLAACYISKRMYSEARGELDELGLPADDPSRGVIDWLTGNKKQALKCAESLKRRAQHEYVDPFYVALFYSGLGDKDAAFAWLEKGFEGRSANMPQMNIEPGFDLLRSDPHFRDLLLRMNLPQSDTSEHCISTKRPVSLLVMNHFLAQFQIFLDTARQTSAIIISGSICCSVGFVANSISARRALIAASLLSTVSNVTCLGHVLG